jgi:putative hydrolase of the HAD superfamily
MAKLRSVLFDVDDTLYSTTEFAEQARRNAIHRMIALGLQMDEDEIMWELTEVISEFSSNYEFHFDKLLLRLPPKAYEGVNRAILVAGAVMAYHETKMRQLHPRDEVTAVLDRLKRAKLILGVITMGPQVKQAEKILRLGLMEYIDPSAIFISDQIGIGKPNVKLYFRACEVLGLEPSEVAYVGDNAPHDVDPPNALGMTTILVEGGGKYAGVKGNTNPDHTIDSLEELPGILREEYGISVPD